MTKSQYKTAASPNPNQSDQKLKHILLTESTEKFIKQCSKAASNSDSRNEILKLLKDEDKKNPQYLNLIRYLNSQSILGKEYKHTLLDAYISVCIKEYGIPSNKEHDEYLKQIYNFIHDLIYLESEASLPSKEANDKRISMYKKLSDKTLYAIADEVFKIGYGSASSQGEATTVTVSELPKFITEGFKEYIKRVKDNPQEICLKILQSKEKPPSKDEEELKTIQDLMSAIENDNIDTVRQIIKSATDLNAEHKNFTALVYAINKGKIEIAQELIKSEKTDLNIKCGKNNNWTALLLASRNGYDVIVKQMIESNRIYDLNYKCNGKTALMWAVHHSRTKAVKELINSGIDLDTEDDQGNTALEIAENNGNNEIVKLIKEAKQKKKANCSKRQKSYAKFEKDQRLPHDPHTLYKIADEYLHNEKVTRIRGAKDALTYIQDAVYYMTLNALEAEKFSKDSDRRWNIDGRAIRMTNCISACAHYLIKNHTAIIQCSTGINWKVLSQFVRIEKYHPFFLTNVSYQNRAKIIRSTLHEEALKGGFEVLRSSCRQLQQNQEFHQDDWLILNFLRLSSFFSDEYIAQYIEEGIKNCQENCRIQNADERARLLRSIMIIGEAFNSASPVLLEGFDVKVVEKFINARIVLCHPEKPENRASIKNALHVGAALWVNGENISLAVFYNDIAQMNGIPQNHLQRYNSSISPTFAIIQDYGDDTIWNSQIDNHHDNILEQTFSRIINEYDRKYGEAEDDTKKQELQTQVRQNIKEQLSTLLETPVKCRTDMVIDEIRDIRYHIIDEQLSNDIAVLQKGFMTWINDHDPHNGRKQQNLRSKLANPQEAIEKMREVLGDNEEKYESIKYKSDTGFTITEEKNILADYPKLQDKHRCWSEYAAKKAKLDDDAKNKKDAVNLEHERDSCIKIVSLVDFCLEHARCVEHHFKFLNDPDWVWRTSGGYKSRGFGSHPNHHVLEFHQIMVGSCARGLLENKSFMGKASDMLEEIFKKTAKPSRGYLAHIGVRLEGKTFGESKDRPDVFYTNSKQIIESVPMLRAVSYALERNLSYDRALQDTTVLVPPGTSASSASATPADMDVMVHEKNTNYGK